MLTCIVPAGTGGTGSAVRGPRELDPSDSAEEFNWSPARSAKTQAAAAAAAAPAVAAPAASQAPMPARGCQVGDDMCLRVLEARPSVEAYLVSVLPA
jgi:hypothetical protein